MARDGRERWLQLGFVPPRRGRGGARSNAGRKRAPGQRSSVPHRLRERLKAEHPVHLTMRIARGIVDLRSSHAFQATRHAILASQREDFRVVHFSVQRDHLHFIVEAASARSLSRGARALAIRIARAANRVTGRIGRVIADRFHARALRTPREVRIGLLYVLMNHKKHLRRGVQTLVDGCSSGLWFEAWRETTRIAADRSPLPSPKTWLLRVGWQRAGGGLSVYDSPRIV